MTNEVPAKRIGGTQGKWRVTTEGSSSDHNRRERPSDLLTRDDIPSIVKAVLDSLPSRNAGTPARQYKRRSCLLSIVIFCTAMMLNERPPGELAGSYTLTRPNDSNRAKPPKAVLTSKPRRSAIFVPKLSFLRSRHPQATIRLTNKG